MLGELITIAPLLLSWIKWKGTMMLNQPPSISFDQAAADAYHTERAFARDANKRLLVTEMNKTIKWAPDEVFGPEIITLPSGGIFSGLIARIDTRLFCLWAGSLWYVVREQDDLFRAVGTVMSLGDVHRRYLEHAKIGQL